jgi:uncharacterized protein YhfF
VSKPIPERYQHLRAFAFGDSPELADKLLELVIKGVKTATCSAEDEPNTSTPGERWVVLDGRREPRCAIESTEVTYRRFNEIDAAFAYDEGEGDRSLGRGLRRSPAYGTIVGLHLAPQSGTKADAPIWTRRGHSRLIRPFLRTGRCPLRSQAV